MRREGVCHGFYTNHTIKFCPGCDGYSDKMQWTGKYHYKSRGGKMNWHYSHGACYLCNKDPKHKARRRRERRDLHALQVA
jgi:hypothetical protein